MRRFFGVLVAMMFVAPAVSAAECPEVIEISSASQDAASSKATLSCLKTRLALVQDKNIERVNAALDTKDDEVYILYFFPGGNFPKIARVEESLVDYDIKKFGDAGQINYVIGYDSSFYDLAAMAYYDTREAIKKGDPARPASVTRLVEQVETMPAVVLAYRWPVPYKFRITDVKAEGK